MFKFEPDKLICIHGELVKFATLDEFVVYLMTRLDNTFIELGEFQRSSQELETELEYQIKELESKNRESTIKLDAIQDENDKWKSRYNTYVNNTTHKLNEYQQQTSELTAMNDRLSNYIRELEQNNDDLERARRALAASLEDFEGQLNQQIERNVLLENEVSEKEELECVVQRLKEEARDLRHELVVNKNSSEQSARRKQLILENCLSSAQKDSMSIHSTNDSILDISSKIDGISLGDQSVPKTPDQQVSAGIGEEKKPAKVVPTTMTLDNKSSSPPLTTESKSQQTSTPSSPTLPSFVMTPSSRISALKLVSNLLVKVGALESKLVSVKKATE